MQLTHGRLNCTVFAPHAGKHKSVIMKRGFMVMAVFIMLSGFKLCIDNTRMFRMKQTVNTHVGGEQGRCDDKGFVRSSLFCVASAMGAAGVSAVKAQTDSIQTPPNCDNNPGCGNHRHFPFMHDVMQCDHARRKPGHQAHTGKKTEEAEHYRQNTAENVAALRNNHRAVYIGLQLAHYYPCRNVII